MVFKASPAQAAVHHEMVKGKQSLIVTAVAGGGKTTTIIEGIKLYREAFPNTKTHSLLLLAFNKSIAETLKQRVGNMGDAKTFHSLGLGALAKKYGSGIFKKIDDRKVQKLCETHLNMVEAAMYTPFVNKLVGLAKQDGIGILCENVKAEWMRLVTHHDLDQELADEKATVEQGVKLSITILNESNKTVKDSIDYNDMIYIPLLEGLSLWGNKLVVVDESQDLNPTRRALARKAMAPGGRLIAVGDPAQAIYGFTGASHDSMDRIKTDFNCKELPLTVSYRCPQAVVRAAQQYVWYIEAHPDAPQGVVREAGAKETFLKTDVILCRNNAPLVSLAYKLLGRGVACRIAGREIGTGLINLVKKMKGTNIDIMLANLEVWREREMEIAIAKGQDNKAQGIEDRAAAIHTIADQMPETDRTIKKLIEIIDGMFSDTKSGILTLSSVHKSKGGEWPRVFILEPGLMPSKWARQEWQQVQERNLIYVAYTRAMEELIMLPMPEDLSQFIGG